MKKTAVIVGVGPGLGKHIALKFGAMDFRVVLLARKEAALKEYQKDLIMQGIETHYYQADAADDVSLKNAFDKIVERFGMIDALIYNVGVTTLDEKTHIDTDTLMERYRVDVAGAYTCIRLLDTEEFAGKNGAILITGGKLATQPHFAFLPLSMDKAALRAMVYAMHPVLKEKGIFLGMVTVMGGIAPGSHFAPEKIAEKYWELYTDRSKIEVQYN